MTTQLYNAELVDLLRSNFPDRQRYAQFQYNVATNWVDAPLKNTTDGEHFNDNDGSYPAGWTQADAAYDTDTDTLYGFWFLGSRDADRTYDYRRQLAINIESDMTSGTFTSFVWGPILYRDAQNPADETFYFGIYANNAGVIDTNTFVRVALNWNSGSGIWQVRGERKDGTTQTNGTWYSLSRLPVSAPIYFSNVINYNSSGTGEQVRTYIGSTRIIKTYTQLTNDVMNDTWGQVWARVHSSRGAGGIESRIFIGAFDYEAGV